jgi:hypothetical protein
MRERGLFNNLSEDARLINQILLGPDAFMGQRTPQMARPARPVAQPVQQVNLDQSLLDDIASYCRELRSNEVDIVAQAISSLYFMLRDNPNITGQVCQHIESCGGLENLKILRVRLISTLVIIPLI